MIRMILMINLRKNMNGNFFDKGALEMVKFYNKNNMIKIKINRNLNKIFN